MNCSTYFQHLYINVELIASIDLCIDFNNIQTVQFVMLGICLRSYNFWCSFTSCLICRALLKVTTTTLLPTFGLVAIYSTGPDDLTHIMMLSTQVVIHDYLFIYLRRFLKANLVIKNKYNWSTSM